MDKPEYHLFVCASFRTSGEPQGVCHRKGSCDFLAYLDNEILDRGLDARVSSTGCVKQCEQGPIMIVYPQGYWYGGVGSEEAIDAILDALEADGIAEEFLL